MNEIIPYDVDSFLMHYGKKGMKWGVRRKPTTAQVKEARAGVKEKRGELRTRTKELRKETRELRRSPERKTARTFTSGKRKMLGLASLGYLGVKLAEMKSAKGPSDKEIREARSSVKGQRKELRKEYKDIRKETKALRKSPERRTSRMFTEGERRIAQIIAAPTVAVTVASLNAAKKKTNT